MAEELNTDELSSEQQVDYTHLRNLLKLGKWKEADQETLAVMLKVAKPLRVIGSVSGMLITDEIAEFPCTDLSTIDRLWVKYSNGRFGFSVQKRLWESVGGTPDTNYYYDSDVYQCFGDCVGWRVNSSWLGYDELTFSLAAPEGHLPGIDNLKISLKVGGILGDLYHIGCPLIPYIASRFVKCNI